LGLYLKKILNPSETGGLIDEFMFVTIKYSKLRQDIEDYDSWMKILDSVDREGALTRKQYYSEAIAEKDKLLNRLKDIRETLVEGAYARHSSS
jgi:hypothetical protein